MILAVTLDDFYDFFPISCWLLIRMVLQIQARSRKPGQAKFSGGYKKGPPKRFIRNCRVDDSD